MTFTNQDAMSFFNTLAIQDPDPLACKFQACNDGSVFDSAYIAERLVQGCSLCDLGSGSGLMVNKLTGHEGKIVCVEPFEQFSRFIEKRGNITIINSTIQEYESDEKFDMITAFGIMQYFNEQEAREIYKKIAALLKPHGLLLIKNQFGLQERVTVNGFSQEMRNPYYSEYRTLAEECAMLRDAGFNMALSGEIYPERFHRWPNTRFMAITAAHEPQCSMMGGHEKP